MIIDAHCHAGKGDLMTAPWNTDAPLTDYLRRACAAGINRTILMPAFHTDNWQANRQVAQIVARHPSRFIGFAFVHAKRDAGRIFRMVRHAVVRWGFRGIKVHGYEAMPTREVCETARALSLPVLVDVASRAETVDMFAPQYPMVNFIIAHLGSFTDSWKAHEQVIHQLARYPNVYADTSGVRQFDYLVRAVQIAGPRKLLFGSDGPWLHPGLELHKVKLLGLKPRDEALVLGGNISHLLRVASSARQLAPRVAGVGENDFVKTDNDDRQRELTGAGAKYRL
ncbi:amidohydrolase family protein [Silvibacterium acidisoli]|uniref:amidohydrolase family protein n=1 Tax=Acidobacteriaceae bacterium ZG23-2 TaxID=2883246 RepID=UPI00406C532B